MYLIISLFISLIYSSGIEVKDAWIRPGAQGMNTAIYFSINNTGDTSDTLYNAKCEVAKVVEVHETYKAGDMMGMRKTDFVLVKGNSSFSFKPGGHHVMLIDLKKKLRVGEKYHFTLYFKKAGEVRVTAEVRK